MRFGLMPCAGEYPVAQMVEHCLAAEELGYDFIFVAEHHGVSMSYFPSPLITLSAVAARTRRIGLGTGILLGALYHPLHLAEDLAMLDHLSGGRVVLGLGVGYRREEFDAFGVDYENRGRQLEETVCLLRRLWSGEAVDYSGPNYRMRGAQLAPRPVQERLPIWMGGWSRPALERAARLADSWFPGPTADNDRLEACYGVWEQAMRRLGRDPARSERPLIREVFVWDSRALQERARAALQAMYEEDYARWGHPNVGMADGDRWASLSRSRFVTGYPEEVAREVRRLRERFGITILIGRMSFHGLPFEDVMRSTRLFAERVIPMLRQDPT